MISLASADNLTTAIVGSPEYPLISRTGTHGLPRNGANENSSHFRGLGSGSPRPDGGSTAHRPDPVPLIPWLPLPPENRGDLMMTLLRPF